MQKFTTSLIGSMPRSQKLLDLKEKSKKDPSLRDEYLKTLREETKNVILLQKECGLDVPVSGELDRDNFVSYVAEHVDGIELMSMDEILEITTDSDSFNESLNQMDASDNSMNNPICVGKIDTDAKLDTMELELLKEYAPESFKITLPSPYILTRSMWLKEVSRNGYKNREELGEDVVKLILNETKRLIANGAKVIQFDEPIISEVVFTRDQGSDNSFY